MVTSLTIYRWPYRMGRIFFITLLCPACFTDAGREEDRLELGFGMAMTMLVINLQGAFHFFLWSMVFLLFLAIFQPRFGDL